MTRIICRWVFFFAVVSVSSAHALTLDEVVKKVETNYKNIVAFQGEFTQAASMKTLAKVHQAKGNLYYKADLDAKKNKLRNKFKWEYTSPTEQEIISDGKTLWMFFPENRQVYIYDLTDTFAQEAANQGQVPGNFLTSLGDLKKEFNVRWGEPSDRDAQGNYIIELTPKRQMVNVRNVFLVVPKELITETTKTTNTAFVEFVCEYDGNECTGLTRFPILASTVYDSFGNMTNIEFRNIEIMEVLKEGTSASSTDPKPEKKKSWTLSDHLFTYLPPAGVEVIKPPFTRPK